MATTDIAAIIPTRHGSKGLSDKNLRTVEGVTLLEIAVRQALRVMGSAYVITDSVTHAEIARAAGAEAIVTPFEVADGALPEDQERWAIENSDFFRPYASVCRLFVTHPLRSDADILRGVGLHRETGETVVSTSRAEYREHQVLMRQKGDRSKNAPYHPRSSNPRRPRQDVQPPDTYLVGCFYLATVESFLRYAFWPPRGLIPSPVPSLRALDVDSLSDLERVRMLWKVRVQLEGLGL